MIRRILAVPFILFALVMPLHAVTAYDIAMADEAGLRNMAGLRGLDTSLSSDELRSALYEAEGLEEYRQDVTEEKGGYTARILSTDSLSSEDGIVRLEGNVSLSFSYGGEERNMTSDMVIIDSDNGSISMIGNVTFPMEDDSSGGISSDIVTFYWERGDLFVESASTMSERENSEKKEVTVYSVGEKLTFLDGGTIVYEDGYIASSDEDPLSSISAKEIMMLPGSDMLIEGATLKIGRVPIFYFPVFFYPGSTITGNPSFGFNSVRGAFLNTTFELLGSSDLISDESSSSFLSIFEDTDADEDSLPVGAYYANAEPGRAQKWARDSGSFIAIMADAYSDFGVHLGLSSKINLFDRKLKLSVLTGLGYTTTRMQSDTDDPLRYYGENSLSYSDFGLELSASLPYYSDRYAKNELLARNTRFSIEPLFGLDSTFPETSSIKSSFERNIRLKYTLPSSYRTNLLSSLTVRNLDLVSSYSWDYDEKSFAMDSIYLPRLDISFSGGYDTSVSLDDLRAEKTEEETEEDFIEKALLSDPLLYPIYSVEKRNDKSSDTFRFAFKYSFSEQLDNVSEYEDKVLDTGELSSTTNLKLSLEADLSRYFSLAYSLSPNNKYSYDEDYGNGRYERTNDFTLSSNLRVSIPLIGLTYTLNNRIYSLGMKDVDGTKTTEEAFARFDKDNVSAHSIALSKSFSTSIGTFSPKLSYTLPPLTGALTPSISYSYDDFSLAFSWKFKEDASGSYSSDTLSASTGYNGRNVVFSLSSTYESGEYDGLDFWAPLDISGQLSFRTADKKYALGELVSFMVTGPSGERNYFKSLRTQLDVPFLKAYVDFSGPADSLELSRINLSSSISSASFQLWRGRIYFDLSLKSTLDLDISNIYASSFSFEPSIQFAIAEFIDLRFGFKTVNNNFGKYVDGNSFSLPLLWQDLLDSFDFFGDGRYHTQFNLSSVSLEIVHYMEDWDLHCKYSSSVVLSEAKYEFVPQLSIYLSWNTFPDLKVDQNWKRQNGQWKESGSN